MSDEVLDQEANAFLAAPTASLTSLLLETASVVNFYIKHGTGPFTELIGVKCTAAYVPIQDNHFLYKVKCNVPDAGFERMLNFKDN